jgi:hypothetical protein
VLALAGVAPDDIATDYELAAELLDDFLATQGTSAREVVLSTLAALDVEAYLRGGGLDDADLEAFRRRVLSPPSDGRTTGYVRLG